MKDFFCLSLYFLYILCLLSGTVLLVEKYDWSPWWFLLTIVFCSINLKVD